MAPLPKRKMSTRRGGKRAASIHVILPGLVTCSQCGSQRRSHRICPNCKQYGHQKAK